MDSFICLGGQILTPTDGYYVLCTVFFSLATFVNSFSQYNPHGAIYYLKFVFV